MKYTKEYLMNTWGVVESKEHAEYVVALAELHGFELFNEFDAGITHFAINKGEVIFTYGAPSVSDHDKQITIPLPPKEKEWPQVGDEALTISDCVVDVLAVNGEIAWVKYRGDAEHYATPLISDLKKPKSKQDLLIEELHQKLLANNCSDEYLLACDIVQGKIEGLSYE